MFDHEVTDPQWYFDLDAPEFSNTDEENVELIRETFSRAGQDLAGYSDAQVNQGIWYLTSPSGSNHMFSIRDGQVSVEQKVQAIRSIYELYDGCFAKRCTEVLGHTDEPGGSDLNPICYMFWDVCPLSYLDGTTDAPVLEEAIFSVLHDTIRIPHRACIEGGLHGLGDIAYRYEDRVKEMIDEFLLEVHLDETLLHYAESARVGDIL